MKYDANELKSLHRLLVYAHNESLILKDMELTRLLCLSLKRLEELTGIDEPEECSGYSNNVEQREEG